MNNRGNIASLHSRDNLSDLEVVLFYESINIVDGDLLAVMRRQNLSRVSFQNRRHYSHRREEFGIAYSN